MGRALSALDDAVGERLARHDQRYTPLRRALVAALANSARPMTIPEIVATVAELPQSSAYRNVTALIEAGVLRRVAGPDDHGRFELAEEFSGHHHHVVCSTCGKVEDVPPSSALEQALGQAIQAVSQQRGYRVTEHRLELLGLCPDCALA